MLEVAHDDSQADFRQVREILNEELQKMQLLSQQGTALTGTPSGFKDLDEITGGFQPGNLIIIAARPSMGKSALVTNIAENAAIDHERAVALFSLEMSETELAQRFVASQGRIFGDKLRKGRVPDSEWPRILEASQKLARAPLFVDDSSDIGILDIRAKARRLHAQTDGGLGLIIIDYLQLLRPEAGVENRVEQVGQMSRGLKILARELGVPVIALSQLSRAVEQRHDKKPILSDLRESGNIEQDADLVMFIYRDEYYNKEESEEQGMADLLIAKHRNGGLGDVSLTFRKEYPKFLNYAGERYNP
jgi:replicative DNA helicase